MIWDERKRNTIAFLMLARDGLCTRKLDPTVNLETRLADFRITPLC